MHSGHSRCHTRQPARRSTGSPVPRRHVEPRLQGNRFRIYCKPAYHKHILVPDRQRSIESRMGSDTCFHTPPVCFHRPHCVQRTASRERLVLLCLPQHHSLSRSSYSLGGSHHQASPYSAFPMALCHCPYRQYPWHLHVRGKGWEKG